MGDKIKIVKVRRLVDIPTKEKVTMDDNDIDILNNLISLSSKKTKPNYYDQNSDDDEDDDFFGKKKKKDKKKDKKKKKKDKKKDKIKKPKLNLDKLKIFDDEVEKDDVDFYEQRFSSSLVLLTDSLKEINDTIVDNKRYLNELKSGQIGEHRIKMSPMTIASQMGNIASLINTKLSAIKQITDVNKSISDLEIKKFNNDIKVNGGKKEGSETNTNLLMDQVFDKLINHNNEIKKAEKELYDEEDDDKKKSKKKKEKIKDDDDDNDKKSKKKKEKKEYDSIDDRINSLMESGELEFTDNESAFKYERDGVEIAIQKKLKTSEWEFIALNSDGDELFDYPLPDKKNIGKVKFDEKSDTAKDALGQKYNVYYV